MISLTFESLLRVPLQVVVTGGELWGPIQVLYLGAASGTSVSHVSDIVGSEGTVFAVEFSHRSGEQKRLGDPALIFGRMPGLNSRCDFAAMCACCP